jgi:hypothetical protein
VCHLPRPAALHRGQEIPCTRQARWVSKRHPRREGVFLIRGGPQSVARHSRRFRSWLIPPQWKHLGQQVHRRVNTWPRGDTGDVVDLGPMRAAIPTFVGAGALTAEWERPRRSYPADRRISASALPLALKTSVRISANALKVQVWTALIALLLPSAVNGLFRSCPVAPAPRGASSCRRRAPPRRPRSLPSGDGSSGRLPRCTG